MQFAMDCLVHVNCSPWLTRIVRMGLFIPNRAGDNFEEQCVTGTKGTKAI